MKSVLMCCVLLACLATTSHAGLDLGWDNCITDGGTSDKTLVCTAGSASDLYGSFILNNTVPQFIGLDFSIDVQTATAPSGDFWNFASGECNDGNLVLDDARLGRCLSVQPTPCLGSGAECNTSFVWAFQFAGSNGHRLVGSIIRDPGAPVALAPTTLYFAFKFRILTRGATETGGTCIGCSDQATITWNSAVATGLSSEIEGETQEEPIEGPGLVGNCVGINGGGPALCCSAHPLLGGQCSNTESKTWGQIKSLYR